MFDVYRWTADTGATYLVWILGVGAALKPPVTSETSTFKCKVLVMPPNLVGKKAYLMNGCKNLRDAKVRAYMYIYVAYTSIILLS